jgi:hypothetical protein
MSVSFVEAERAGLIVFMIFLLAWKCPAFFAHLGGLSGAQHWLKR